MTERADLCRELRHGFFLSSMMGVADGAFCGERSGGCAMVQLGAYLAEPTATAEEMGGAAPFYLPADPVAWVDFLAEECRAAKRSPDLITCLNLAALELDLGLRAAESFSQAGGDLLELNAHGGVQRYLDRGKLRASVLPENQGELFRWVEAFAGLTIPLIVKFSGGSDRGHLLHVLDEMADWALFGVHVNVRDERTHKPDVELVQRLQGRAPGMLWVSGYVRSAGDAHALFEAGADAVGIAAPTRGDAEYIRRIAEAFKAEYGSR